MVLGETCKLEAVQGTFSARLSGLDGLNYWQRLEKLYLYSLERRRERYLAIYAWKMIRGMTPAIVSKQVTEVQVTQNDSRNRYCILPNVNRRLPVTIQTLLEHSLPINGARVFNSLSRHRRECKESLTVFKSKLENI